MFGEISNFVQKTVHKAIASSNNRPVPARTEESALAQKDDLVAIRKYFEDLENSKDDDEPEDVDIHKSDVKYLTMKPVKDMDEDRFHTGKVIISGKLWKQGRRVNKWKERLFTLRETGLSYYSNPEAGDIVVKSIANVVASEEQGIVKVETDTLGREIKVPRTRGNMFFADIVTPTGHVAEDLNKLNNKSLLGGKQNCFCVQTEGNIYILSANRYVNRLS